MNEEHQWCNVKRRVKTKCVKCNLDSPRRQVKLLCEFLLISALIFLAFLFVKTEKNKKVVALKSEWWIKLTVGNKSLNIARSALNKRMNWQKKREEKRAKASKKINLFTTEKVNRSNPMNCRSSICVARTKRTVKRVDGKKTVILCVHLSFSIPFHLNWIGVQNFILDANEN